MKRTIIVLLFAVLSAASMMAQNAARDLYIIDGEAVTGFDGSQLVGKKITTYAYDKEKSVHVIFTTDSKDVKEVDSDKIKVLIAEHSGKSQEVTVTANSEESRVTVVKSKAEQLVYVVDGKEVSHSEFNMLKSSDIKSMEIVKHKDSPTFKKYAKENTTGIILITTKK